MKINKRFGLAALVLLMVCGVVFGQYPFYTKPDIFGGAAVPTLANYQKPNVDANLLTHALYGEDQIDMNGAYLRLPKLGNTGTLGTIKVENAGTFSSSCGPTVRVWNVSNSWGSAISVSNPAPAAGNTYNFIYNTSGVTISPSGSGVSVQKLPAGSTQSDLYPESLRPKLPDLSRVNWTSPPAGADVRTSITGGSIGPGVVVCNNISINGTTLTVERGTIVYVKDFINVFGSGGPKIILAGGNPSPAGCDEGDDIGVLFLVNGSGDAVSVDIGGSVVGTYIAPNGTIKSVSTSKYNGQILAKKLFFTNEYDAGLNMIFTPYPVINDPLKITPVDLTFTRAQCDASYTSEITIALPQALTAGQSISFDYRIVPTGTPVASVGDVGNETDATIAAGYMGWRTISFTAASQNAFVIPLTIKNDGITFYANKTFDIEFRNMNAVGVGMALPETAKMKINMVGTAETKPVTPTVTQSTTGPIESHTLKANTKVTAVQSGWTGTGAGQIVATLPSVTGITYKITQDYPNSTTPWFAINGNDIVTTANYAADYENATHRNSGFIIKYAAVRAANKACLRDGNEQSFTIYPRPWNDNAFVPRDVTGALAKTITERGQVNIVLADWFPNSGTNIDADQLPANNRQYVVGITGTQTNTGTWNTTATNNTFSTALGTITINTTDRQTVTYSQSSRTAKVCEPRDSFYITVRDSGDYRSLTPSLTYATDHFDKSVKVVINITPGNFFDPEPQSHSITLCKYDNRNIPISNITITDQDDCGGTPKATNSFAASPAPVSRLNAVVPGIGVAVSRTSNTNLSYNLTGFDATKTIPAQYLEANGAILDTIIYTVSDGVNSGEGKIAVKINPAKDKKPTGDSIDVTAVLGTPFETNNLPSKANWSDNNAPLAANLVVQGNVGDVYTLNPAATGFSVQLLDPATGKFVITSPVGSTDETSRIFKYVIVDTQASGCSAFDKNKVSDSIIVKINFEKPKETAVIPEDGIIIAIQNRDTTKLFDNITESLWDLVPTNANGYYVTEVKIGEYAPKTGSVAIQPDGKFTYNPGAGFAMTDFFSYQALSNDGVWSQIDGNINVYINLRNLNEPVLVEKADTVNALETKKIKVVDSNDSDKDTATILKLDKTKNPIADNSNAEVFLAGGDSISFKYLDKELTDTIDVVVTFWVNDSVNYTEYFYNDGVLDSTRYIEFGSYPNKITVTVLPNPKAISYKMFVSEFGVTDTLIGAGGEKYPNLKGGVSFLNDALNPVFALKDSTKYGALDLNPSSGRVVYTHEKEMELYDEFYYYLIITLPDGTKDTTEGKVIITISARAPQPNSDGAFYEDKNADGIVDKITIPFDREVNALGNTVFDVVFGTDTTLNVKAEYVDETKKLITLTEFKAAEYKTSGVMEVSITHNNFPNESEQKVFPFADRAAPIIKSAQYTQVPGGNDTLLITMSEFSEVKNNKTIPPFLFVVAKDIFFDNVIDNGNGTYILALTKESSGKIASGDSVFVNAAASVKDIIAGTAKNIQDNPANKRAPIFINVVTKIVSATYLDTNATRDGWIDLIRIDLGTTITQEIADSLAKSLVLSPTRAFTKGNATLNAAKTGFDLSVKEDGANIKNTGLYDDDLVSVPTLPAFKNITIQASSEKAKDGVAPVILYAEYTPASAFLDVVFSEDVTAENGNAYRFWDTDPGKEFSMTFESPERPANIAANILRYNVKETGIAYPVAGDSIWIIKGGIVGDTLGNIQDLTVRAPLKLNGKYDGSLEVFVVPNPLFLVKTGKGHEPKALPKSLMDYYEIPYAFSKGVALIVEARGPITKLNNMSGFIKILDQTGNTVSDEIPLTPILAKNGMNAVAVWGGKNSYGRNVGAGSYLAIIQVQVKFDDRDTAENFVFQKIILVTTANDASGK